MQRNCIGLVLKSNEDLTLEMVTPILSLPTMRLIFSASDERFVTFDNDVSAALFGDDDTSMGAEFCTLDDYASCSKSSESMPSR